MIALSNQRSGEILLLNFGHYTKYILTIWVKVHRNTLKTLESCHLLQIQTIDLYIFFLQDTEIQLCNNFLICHAYSNMIGELIYSCKMVLLESRLGSNLEFFPGSVKLYIFPGSNLKISC